MPSQLMEDLDEIVKDRERLSIENKLLRKAWDELLKKYVELDRYNKYINTTLRI